MANRQFTILLLALAVLVVGYNSLFIVKETERAVMLKFGEIVDPDVAVGLGVKTPFVHVVRKFERRILTLDAPTQRFLTNEKKPLDVDFYAKWRVADTETFYTATNGEEIRAEGLLAQKPLLAMLGQPFAEESGLMAVLVQMRRQLQPAADHLSVPVLKPGRMIIKCPVQDLQQRLRIGQGARCPRGLSVIPTHSAASAPLPLRRCFGASSGSLR